MVLAGDDYASRVEILDRMVRAVMAELHLHGLGARSEAHQLVSEADAEHRDDRGVEDFADRLDGVIARLRVAGAVGQEHAVRLHSQNFFCGKLRGYHGDARAALGKHTQDVALDAVVIRDDVNARLLDLAVALAELPATFAPLVTILGSHELGEVHARKAGKTARLAQCLRGVDLAARLWIASGDEAAVLRALAAQKPRQPAGI